MVLVLAMMIGIGVGFVSGILGADMLKPEEKTTVMIVKALIALAMIACGGVISFMKDWSYLLSFALGVAVGLAPYFSRNEVKDETDKEEE